MKKKLLVFALCVFAGIAFAGGGWPQPKRKGYFKLAQNWIISPFFYTPSGKVIDITTIGLYTTSLYGEYGISDRLTAIVYFPFFVRNTLNEVMYRQSGMTTPGDEANSVGDTDISLKYGLIVNKPVVMSVTALFGLPVGRSSAGATGILQSGDGEFNQIIRVDASYSFYPKPFYTSAYAGFNNRTHGFSDEVRFGLEVGATFAKFVPVLKLNVVESLFNGTSAEVQNGIFSNNTEYVSPTIELNYQWTERLGLSVSGGFAVSGRNILASPNWSAGVYLKL